MGNCSIDDAAFPAFSKYVDGQLLRINALLVAHTVLMVVMVGIGAYGHRYRHHPLIRYIFLGVTTLFLPIVSYIISTVSNLEVIAIQLPDTLSETFSMVCDSTVLINLLVWSALVQIVGISTTIIVAADAREARDIAPSVVLFVEAIWTCYLLTIEVTKLGADLFSDFVALLILCSPWAFLFAKLIFKYYSWYKARQSLALGHNPPLIAGYMEQLQADRSQQVELGSEHMPPRLIVTGEEDTESVQKQPHGYSFKWISNRGDGRTRRINNNCLVTMDKVWQMLPRSTAHEQLKDVCFSFALFKLLRCRFARYTVADAGFIDFLRHVLLEERDDERVLGVIACELTFLHDYYYSSLPISYSKSWLPILSIFISLLSMGYCLFIIVLFSVGNLSNLNNTSSLQQLSCSKPCNDETIRFGSVWFLVVPLLSLLALVCLAEVREIASYICSNWTKIALIRYHASWQQSPTMKKWVSHLLQSRCKMLKHWEDKMNLCSIIVLHPAPLARLRHLISLPDQKKKVPTAVKVALIQALRRHVRAGNIMATPKLQLQVGDNLLWTFSGAKGTADIMLVCHVATSILEVRSDQPHWDPSDHKIAATHLSQYCAYLVAYCPELLPDFDLWCKSLYKAVKKEAEERIGMVAPEAAATPQVKYQLLHEQLSRAKHEVLKNGAELGKQLVELPQGEDKAWEVLARFWSEMILHVTPSDNLDGHAEAIARGGELITLLWALLGHLGKPDYTAPDAAC